MRRKARPALAEAQRELDEVKAEIEGLEATLRENPARELIHIIPRRGWRKGEVTALTKRQFKELLGYEPKPGAVKNGKVRWEYALDQLATEKGFPSSDELKEAIEKAREDNERLKKLKSELSYLKARIKEIEKEPIKCETIKLDEACPVFPKEPCKAEVTECNGMSFKLVRQPSYWVGYANGKPQFVSRYAKEARKEMKTIIEPLKNKHSNPKGGSKMKRPSKANCPHSKKHKNPGTKAYCFICKEKVEVLEPREKKLKHGNTLTQGKCPKGHKVAVIGKK